MGRSILTTCGQWAMTGLVVLGLLLTPVTCTLVAHPHSLFDTPEAVERDGHAAHPDSLGPLHAMAMVNGAPPLAGAIPLPDLHPGTVAAWLADRESAVASSVVDGAGGVPGAAALPAVSAAAMTMVASGLNALHVTLLFLLAVALIAIRPLPGVAALAGRALATIAPPPKRFAVV